MAGFAAFKNHLSYLPFQRLGDRSLPTSSSRYAMTKSSLHFPIDRPLPKALVEKLITVRLAQVDRHSRSAAATAASTAVPPGALCARTEATDRPRFACRAVLGTG